MISIKKLSIIALVLLLMGVLGIVFTFASFEQEIAVTEEKRFDNNITAIKMNIENVAINVLPTKEQMVRVELTGNESSNTKYDFTADVEGTTLAIKLEENQQSWFNIFPTALMIKVYLPRQHYKALQVETNNGFVRLDSLNIKDVKIKSTNGMIDMKSIIAVDVNVETKNGKITFHDVDGKVRGKTENGPITFAAESIDRPIQLETGAGKISIQAEQKPGNVMFDVYTGTGIINIFDSYKGSTIIGNGENLVKLTTRSGSITVSSR